MQCSHCQHENSSTAKFCEECGASLIRTCSDCGHEVRASAKFCEECGARLTDPPLGPNPVQTATSIVPEHEPLSYTPEHLADKIPTSRSTLEGERKQVTVLFADIKGSMALLEDLDPEDARRLIDPALQLMMDAVHRYEGFVAQTMGDGIMALFGAPIAHEDHPQRALYAALQMQATNRRYAETTRLDHGVPILLRVGINTGEVVVRSIRKDDLHADYVPVGHATGLAARMESLADPGAIIVSDHTYQLTEGYFSFNVLGQATIKGVSQPLPIYEVTGMGPLRTRLQRSAQRGLVRFVGRQPELALMQRAMQQTAAGQGQIVALVGEAGVGKSRLVYESKVRLPPDVLVLETFSVSHGKAFPYLPLIDLLKSYFAITSQDDARARREKVTGKVLTLERRLEETLPYLFSLLDVPESQTALAQMAPEVRRYRTFEAIKQLLLRESMNQPVVVIVEDLHWLDTETEAFLDVLSDSVAAARFMLWVNYRPEYQHGWGNKPTCTQLRLDPLGTADADDLLSALVGESPEVEPLKQMIRQRTQGNPFFMEEIVHTLYEEKVLLHNGQVTLERPLGEVQIPPTVQGILTARIDRLSRDEKQLLQTLAVIGKAFPFGLIQQVVELSDNLLLPGLAHLQEAEFVYELPAFPEPDYTFKHALTQEVAYGSLLAEQRARLHEQTAQAIEALYAERLEEHYAALARHYQHSDNTAKAVTYLYLAGQQATERSAHAEAIEAFTVALDLISAQPDATERQKTELDMQTAYGIALIQAKGFTAPEVGQTFSRAHELCRQVGEPHQFIPIVRGLWTYHHIRGELQTAREIAEHHLALGQRHDQATMVLHAHRFLGQTLSVMGILPSAREHLEQAIHLYDPEQLLMQAAWIGIDPQVSSLAVFGTAVLWHLGYPEQALQSCQNGLALAQERSHPFTFVFTLRHMAVIHQLRGEGRAALEQSEALLELAREHGFRQFENAGLIMQGRALSLCGQVDDGIHLMQQGWEHYTVGADVLRVMYLSFLAEAYGRQGQPDEGLRLLDQAQASIDVIEARGEEAEIRRLKGELLRSLAGDHQSEAEACFHQALDIARYQHAKSWELRAATSLARLWQSQGKRSEARELLAPVYEWFTEGFDTTDLIDAKALMDELSSACHQG